MTTRSGSTAAVPTKAQRAAVKRSRKFRLPPLLPNPDALPDLPAGPKLVLPYPPAALNPNDHSMHRARKSGIVKRYREDCWKLALERFGVGGSRLGLPLAPVTIPVALDFFPPRRGKRDDDNAEAAFKAGRDGIADALRIDDTRFVITRRLHEEPRGCVVVTFTGLANADSRPL